MEPTVGRTPRAWPFKTKPHKRPSLDPSAASHMLQMDPVQPCATPHRGHVRTESARLSSDLASWRTSDGRRGNRTRTALSALLMDTRDLLRPLGPSLALDKLYAALTRSSSARYEALGQDEPVSGSASSASLPTHALPTIDEKSVRPTTVPTPRDASRDSALLWLSLYFAFNLGLTLYNKAVLVRFPYPYTITAIHSLCSMIGSLVVHRSGMYVRAKLRVQDELVLLAFSTLYSLNISISNVSLRMVSIPFHQVVRSTTPVFVLAISAILLRSTCSRIKLIALVPVMLGVAIATYGDYSSTTGGFLLTLLGTFLAASKVLATGLLQSRPDADARLPWLRLGLHPFDLLARMSPLAFAQCVLLAHTSGELARVAPELGLNPGRAWVLAGNGALAFGMNVVSFAANRRAGALTMTVAGNVKQVLTILLAVLIFDTAMSPLNGAGVALTLVGGGWYSWLGYSEKQQQAKAAAGSAKAGLQ